LEDLPNARLIAAAPELLAALRYLCAHVEAAPEITRLDLQDVLRAVREGRAAIAKAEGA
jgi:hypothetical protein